MMNRSSAHFPSAEQVRKHRIQYERVDPNSIFSDKLPSIRDPRPPDRVVNRHGEPIKLSSYQKNHLYRQAKEIREQLRDQMCTRRETHWTDPKTVRKMRESEFPQHGRIEYMKKALKAIGADPRDYDQNKIRRRGYNE